MQKHPHRSPARGFTLIELLIVMAILGMLAAIAIPSLMDRGELVKVDAAKAQISQFETTLDMYKLDIGKYPRSLEALIRNDGRSKTWNGPYLKKKDLPKDPWGNEYQYRSPGRHNKHYDLYSYGDDGQEGGEGLSADVTNW